jgi:hypothetical protein
MEPDPNAIDWNSLSSALIGGGVAILGVFLAAWRERIARQTEEKARFQRDTLIALQDTLTTFLRATYALHLWRDAPRRWEDANRDFAERMAGAPDGLDMLPPFDWGQHSQQLLDTDELKVWRDSRFEIEALVSRIDNEAVRNDVARLVEETRPVLTQPVMDEAEAITNRLNIRIGLLIRDGAVTPMGFIAPGEPRKRRLL